MINRILSFFVSLATIAGIVIGLLSYEAGQRQSRIDRAFEFYKDYRASALDADMTILSDKWNEQQEEASKFVPKDGPVDEQGLLRLQTSVAQDAKVGPALFRVVTFFDRLAQCIRAGLCDSDTAYALLRDPASLLVSSYGSYLTVHVQQDNSNTAHGVFIVNDLPTPSLGSFLRWWWQNPTGAAAPSQNQ
jgi:hypothetical protein